VVDATGRRFADESQDYNSFIRAYFAACERDLDRGNGRYRSGPMYVVFDQRFLDRFAVGNVSAHPVCAGYPGAGGTLGPALTMAYLAGQSVGAGTAGRRAATSMARRQ
jgi:hypothetical protein